MTFTSIHELADFIASKHVKFNGHLCSVKANVRVFDTLRRMYDFLRNNPEAISCNFSAVCNPAHFGGEALHTIITLSLEPDGIGYAEQICPTR